MKKSITDVIARLTNPDYCNWNGFYGVDVARHLKANLKYIADVMWLDSCEDTVFVIPKAGKLAAVSLTLMGHQMNADEIDFVKPKHVLHQVVENYGYKDFDHVTDADKVRAKAFVKGRKGDVLRLWWD